MHTRTLYFTFITEIFRESLEELRANITSDAEKHRQALNQPKGNNTFFLRMCVSVWCLNREYDTQRVFGLFLENG